MPGHSELAASLYYRRLVRQLSQNSAYLHPFRHRAMPPIGCESKRTTLPPVGSPIGFPKLFVNSPLIKLSSALCLPGDTAHKGEISAKLQM